jgi:hypothetical protein
MATMISQSSPTFFTLLSPKGKKIEVALGDPGQYGYAGIFIKRNGMASRLPMGKHYHALHGDNKDALRQAIESYKSTDVKAALRSLLSYLV